VNNEFENVTGSRRGLVLSSVPIFVASELNHKNHQRDKPYPGLNPKPSKHEAGMVRFSALLKEAVGCGVEES